MSDKSEELKYTEEGYSYSTNEPFTPAMEWWGDLKQAQEMLDVEDYMRKYMSHRGLEAGKKHYLVDGAVLRCTHCTLEPQTPFNKEFSAPEGSDKVILKTEQNKTAKNKMEQCFATKGDSKKFINISPFGNCKNPPDRVKEKEAIKVAENSKELLSLGTCRYMMELNDEWEVLMQIIGYEDEPGVDLEKIKTLTMESILFCKHGGFIYPIDSGYIEAPDKMEEWLNDVNTVAQWYVADVKTYCHMTWDDIQANDGKSSTAQGRKWYECDLDGNLKGHRVADDCSGFLWACLVQAGYFDESTPTYTSGNYFPNKDGGQALEEAGFSWHAMSELGVDNMEKGDIMVRNGHVEIFSHFEGKTEYAWTWGKVYLDEPARKDSSKSEVAVMYSGIWRLEIE